jgi:Fur family ferric uptake transcriptional regulator
VELERPADAPWVAVRDELRSRGLRWTPQRRLILDVLAATSGHVTGSEIVDRCRARDAETTPSTVYRTLDVLEELGYLSHSHGPDGREEFHVLPEHEHAHLQCVRCGASTELAPEDARRFVAELERSTGFRVDIGHLTVAGTCSGCGGSGSEARRAEGMIVGEPTQAARAVQADRKDVR